MENMSLSHETLLLMNMVMVIFSDVRPSSESSDKFSGDQVIFIFS
jgi:hypothetical protein